MTLRRAFFGVFMRLPLALAVLIVTARGGVVLAAVHGADSKPKDAVEQAINADPAASARRTFARKRVLQHAAVADAAAQRSATYLATLPSPAAPGTPAAASIADGNGQLAYVRREHATPRSRGVVVLFDDRERLPATTAMLGRVAENLALRGWDTWTLALPQVAPGVPLPRERSHARVPVVEPADQVADGVATPATSNAKAAAKDATARRQTAAQVGPKLSRRRWAVPVVNAQALPASGLVAWRALALQRMALLMQAAQAAAQTGGLADAQSTAQAGGQTATQAAGPTTVQADRETAGHSDRQTTGPVPVVVVGAGLAADFVARQAVAERWTVAALVLIDLLPPPADLALALDSDVAALRAPTLAISWREPDPIAPGVWLRHQQTARRALPAATEEDVGRVVGGWIDREMRSAR